MKILPFVAKRKKRTPPDHVAGELIQLEDHKPHYSGLARCLQCKHEWMAVAPAVSAYLQCPKCDLHHGVYVGLHHRSEPHWNCKCGNGLFAVTPNGAYCPHCDTDQALP